jgi:hypothetical protein
MPWTFLCRLSTKNHANRQTEANALVPGPAPSVPPFVPCFFLLRHFVFCSDCLSVCLSVCRPLSLRPSPVYSAFSLPVSPSPLFCVSLSSFSHGRTPQLHTERNQQHTPASHLQNQCRSAPHYRQYSGFHLAPQLASRAAGAPPARRTRGSVGGTGHVVTRNLQAPFSEFSNFDYLQS